MTTDSTEMDARQSQLEIYRNMAPNDRIAAACALHDFAHGALRATLRRASPDKSDRDIELEVAARLLNEPTSVLRARIEDS